MPRIPNLMTLSYAWVAHQVHPTKPKNAVRLFDGKTPYGVHPTAAACLLALEPLVPEEFRFLGYEALLLHDVLEDTTSGLPDDIEPRVAELVQGLTFDGGSAVVRVQIWEREPFVQLLKLYDVLTNAMDGVDGWMKSRGEEYISESVSFMQKLAEHVESQLENGVPWTGYSKPKGRLNVFRFIESF